MSMLPALRSAAGNADRFVIVDTETTGLFNADRVLELALITLSIEGQVIDIYETLVQPQRAATGVDIHGITDSMLLEAPTFDQIAGDVAVRLHGACMVAHNLPFDRRMLTNEFRRLDLELVVPGGIDTLRATGRRLAVACEMWGIPHENAHSARSDALATADLFVRVAHECEPGTAMLAPTSILGTGKTLRRGDTTVQPVADTPLIVYFASRLQHSGLEAAMLPYLECVGRAVADLHVTADEQRELAELAKDLGLSEQQVQQCHRRYLNELMDTAVSDGEVTDDEYDMLLRIARGLEIDESTVSKRVDHYRAATGEIQVQTGMSVVITGEHPTRDRNEIARAASALGLVVQSSVSRTTSLVAAADPGSNSGKAAKARQYGVPIVELTAFAQATIGTRLAVAEGGISGLKVISCPECLTTWTEPATRIRHATRRCKDCGGSDPDTGPVSTAPRSPASGPSTEMLTCHKCGVLWERAVGRGRKPHFCPTCASLA
jgi:DNA polymerase-3 subunit epsilon